MGGTPTFEGAIYAPYADVNLSGTVNFTGMIIGETITGGGDIQLDQKSMGLEDWFPSIIRKLYWDYE